jgi:hypothetical protein
MKNLADLRGGASNSPHASSSTKRFEKPAIALLFLAFVVEKLFTALSG